MSKKRVKSRAQKDKHCVYAKKYRDANKEKVSAAVMKWKRENPQILKVHSAKYRLRLKMNGIPRKRDPELARRHRKKWNLAHPDRIKANGIANRKRKKDGVVGVFTCSNRGCPYRVRTRRTKCGKCLAEMVSPQVMTMHDRAIAITDFWRGDGSLPPMHTIKSRAKNGVQWIT